MKRGNGQRGPDKKPRKPGSGGAHRSAKGFAFRDWCRNVATSPIVQKTIRKRAQTDAEFALKVAEHGFGRPPQSLDVNLPASKQGGLAFVFPGGVVLSAAATGLPGADAGQRGDG